MVDNACKGNFQKDPVTDASVGSFSVPFERIYFYDAAPEVPTEELESYWRSLKRQPDVQLGWGFLRGVERRRRQKGVDTLLATDMLVGGFNKLFDVALLFSGDEDFVPVVQELKRMGVKVLVLGFEGSCSVELIEVSDRYFLYPRNKNWNGYALPLTPKPGNH